MHWQKIKDLSKISLFNKHILLPTDLETRVFIKENIELDILSLEVKPVVKCWLRASHFNC